LKKDATDPEDSCDAVRSSHPTLLCAGSTKLRLTWTRAQLAISPQCGFASDAEAQPPQLDEQYCKLSVAVETAQRWFAGR
jgi:hypothetical protein